MGHVSVCYAVGGGLKQEMEAVFFFLAIGSPRPPTPLPLLLTTKLYTNHTRMRTQRGRSNFLNSFSSLLLPRFPPFAHSCPSFFQVSCLESCVPRESSRFVVCMCALTNKARQNNRKQSLNFFSSSRFVFIPLVSLSWCAARLMLAVAAMVGKRQSSFLDLTPFITRTLLLFFHQRFVFSCFSIIMFYR